MPRARGAIRASPDNGLYVKFRSYLNHHFPPEDEVVEPELRLEPATGRGEDRERQLLEHACRGESLPAMRLAEELYGFSTTEAERFIDELLAGESADESAGPRT